MSRGSDPLDGAARAREVPLAIRVVLIVGATAAPIYGLVTHTGPYRWLADAQLDLFGRYYPVMTLGVAWIICIVPAFVLLNVLDKLWSR